MFRFKELLFRELSFGVIFVILKKISRLMVTKKLFAGVLFTAVITVLISSCQMETKTIEPYIISIDSISAPDTVTIKTVFDVEVFGYVGPSKCYAFDKTYYYANEKNEIEFESWGRYTYIGDPCADELVWMDDKVEISVSTPGIYTLKGLKANATYTTKTLVVK